MQEFAAAQYYWKLKYPHLSNLSVSNFVTVSLIQKNYLICESQVLNMIDTTGFSGFIDGSLLMPPKFVSHVLSDRTEQIIQNIEYPAWKRSHRLLKAWITSSISDELLPYTIG